MDLIDLVRLLKYKTDTDSFLQHSADLVMRKKVPTDKESLVIIAALAVSDQKNGIQPTSNNLLYQQVYKISQSI